MSRPAIYKYIDKTLTMGIDASLRDKYHTPTEPIITKEAKAWIINLTCNKPTSYGYASEVWSHRLFAAHA